MPKFNVANLIKLPVLPYSLVEICALIFVVHIGLFALLNGVSFIEFLVIIFFFLHIALRLPSSVSFVLALVCLIDIPLLQALNRQRLSESFAVYAFYFLCIGTFIAMLELKREGAPANSGSISQTNKRIPLSQAQQQAYKPASRKRMPVMSTAKGATKQMIAKRPTRPVYSSDNRPINLEFVHSRKNPILDLNYIKPSTNKPQSEQLRHGAKRSANNVTTTRPTEPRQKRTIL